MKPALCIIEVPHVVIVSPDERHLVTCFRTDKAWQSALASVQQPVQRDDRGGDGGRGPGGGGGGRGGRRGQVGRWQGRGCGQRGDRHRKVGRDESTDLAARKG